VMDADNRMLSKNLKLSSGGRAKSK